jgi:alcohol dehydrogenase
LPRGLLRAGYHPMADGIAVEGMRLVFANLPKAVADGNDLDARANMMSAAAMGATAFQKGLGAIHCALASGRRALRHPSRHDQRRVHALRARVQPRGDRAEDRTAGGFLEIDGGFDGFLEAVLNLREEIGVPHDLGGLKVDGGKVETIAEMAVVDPTAGGNPIPVTKEAGRRRRRGLSSYFAALRSVSVAGQEQTRLRSP